MDRTLDVTGLNCPLPVLRARKALGEVSVGGCLTVLATDPASVIDFRHFCDTSGHQLVQAHEADGVYSFVIRRTG